MLFLALVFVELSFAQNLAIIDTTNHDYRQKLENFYIEKSNQTILYFKKLEDRKVKKEIEEICKENKTEFLEKIRKGNFVNDPKYSQLVNTLFENLKTANPQIGDIKFLFELGDEPNAYNFGEDIVVVYLPLIEKIDNKYQLGFIISHEIAHQLLDHSKKSLLKQVQIGNSEKVKQDIKAIAKQKYNKGQSAKLLYKKIVYGSREESRKKEIEADSLGFVLYNKAFENQNHQAIATLELLNTIDKEKDSLTEKEYKMFFNSEKQPFKKEWIINNELDNYQYDKTLKFWQIDSLKSHPDCLDRIAILKKNFKNINGVSKIEDSEFLAIKKSSNIDVIVGLHFLKEYGSSLYQTLLQLKQDPQNTFLKKMVFDNLIKIQEAQKNYTLNKYLETIDPHYSNSYNTFLYFIRKLRKAELENIIESYKY